MKKTILYFVVIILFYSFSEISSVLYAQDVFQDCPMEGKTEKVKHKETNRKKNRYNIPIASQFDLTVTLATMLQGEDTIRLKENKAIEITAWVHEVKRGGPETCNCGHKGQDSSDVHIEIAPKKTTTTRKKIIYAEITPRLRTKIFDQLGIESNNGLLRKVLKNHKVKIQGWLFYDVNHKDQAYNIDTQDNLGRKNSRATVWEIHPITSIEIIE